MGEEGKTVRYAGSFKEQFTLRGVVIGVIGAVILTMSSLYVALRLGALPWPIIFVALISLFFLKLFKNTNINEINVTHTIMSAGAMTAGGLAFTIPGIYMLNPQATVNMTQLIVVVLGGVILGLIFTALIRNYFVVSKALPYPMGQTAAEILMVGDEGGQKSKTLFSSLGLVGLFTFLRDGIPAIFPGKVWIPSTIMSSRMMQYGSLGGIWLSPMLVSVGYLIGPVAVGVWFLGAVIGDFGLLLDGMSLGIFKPGAAAAMKSSLGIGLMVGTGLGIIVKGILPKAREIFGPLFSKASITGGFISLRWAPFVMVLLAVVFTTVCGMGIVPSLITILGVWLTVAMSAQVVGQSGLNPMEIFGIIVLLAVKAVSSIGQTEAFFVAAVVAIASGLVGDVMNDFKSGYLLKSDPRAQWLGECIGGLVGAFVSVGVFGALITVYGPYAFGPGAMFAAPQASAVAAMVGGIPHTPSFLIGLIAGCMLYVVNFPVMTLGLGVYLPFYLSLTAFIGGALRFGIQKFAPAWEKKGYCLIVASGMLGGEAVIGVIIAMYQAVAGFLVIGK
jgi:uncharacterized oligopeptide transporter (OPT) family protein